MVTATKKKIIAAQAMLLPQLPHLPPGCAATHCWACGHRAGADLERAHLVARANGGSNTDPRNFLLLCYTCHRDQPDGAPRAEQLAWLLQRAHWRVRCRARHGEQIGTLVAQLREAAGSDGVFAAWWLGRGAGAIRRIMDRGYEMSAATNTDTGFANAGAALVADLKACVAADRVLPVDVF